MKKAILLIFSFTVVFGLGAYSQVPLVLDVNQPLPLQVDAGADIQIVRGDSTILGGAPTASQGYGDYVFLWTPAEGLNNPSAANPIAKPENTTTYLLTVLDGNNCTASGEITVTVEASGIGPDPIQLQFRCFPNPVEDELLIEMSGMPTVINIRIFNTMGTEMIYRELQMTGTEAIERITTRNLPVGVYYLQLVAEKNTYYQSIIKTR